MKNWLAWRMEGIFPPILPQRSKLWATLSSKLAGGKGLSGEQLPTAASWSMSECHLRASSWRAVDQKTWHWFIGAVIVPSVSCVWFCDPVKCSTPGFPVPRYLSEFAQTHVHWVSDAIQPSHPLLSLSPPAFNLSRHQGLFQWVSSW